MSPVTPYSLAYLITNKRAAKLEAGAKIIPFSVI
jgi:hypothetical protein